MHSKLLKLFINNVHKLLNGRSNYWLSKESGLSQSTLSRLMSGEASPSLESLEAISMAFEVTPASLISEDKPQKMQIQKTVKHELDAGQFEAIKSIVREMTEQEGMENPEMYVLLKKVPPDIIESLVAWEGDWNLLRAVLDIPEVKTKGKRGNTDAG